MKHTKSPRKVIAAAPDLLKVCKYFSFILNNWPMPLGWSEFRIYIENAIAKAEGGSHGR